MTREELNFIKKNNCYIFPKIVQLEITDECPFSCPQCYKSNLAGRHMDYNKLTNMIQECHDKGTLLFALNGGEPLLYNRFRDLICFLNKNNIEANLFTSGFGIDDEWLSFWKQYGKTINLFISLNGSTEEVNGLSRQGYEVTMNAINLIQKNGIPYYINWVARKNNLKDFPRMIQLAEEKECLGIEINCEKLNGSNKLNSPLDREDILELADLINGYTGNVKMLVEKCFSLLMNFIKNTNRSIFDGCYAGKMMCMYTLDYEFAPCTHLPYSEKFKTIDEYWEKSELLYLMRTMKKQGKCVNCKYTKCNFCKSMSVESFINLGSGLEECPIYEKIAD